MTTSIVRAAQGAVSHDVLVVAGAPGEERYGAGFAAAVNAWTLASEKAGARCVTIGVNENLRGRASENVIATPVTEAEVKDATQAKTPESVTAEGPPDTAPAKSGVALSDRERIHAWIAGLDGAASVPVWIVFIGHGSFDRKNAWLNLRGPDVSTEELATWLKPMTRTVVVVNGGSASGPFVPALSGKNRVVIAATRTGDELNYARFGERFAEAIGGTDADLDGDGGVSLLEAFVTTARRVEGEYAEANRMISEHALIDDNGDKLGTPAEWFQGVRVVKKTEDGKPVDGFLARGIVFVGSTTERALSVVQREERDGLERELENLRERRVKLGETEYLRALEPIVRKLGALYSPAATP